MMNAVGALDGNHRDADRFVSEDRIQDDTHMATKIAVVVDNDYISRDKLLKHFGKTKNGGGGITSLIYPYKYKGRNVAVIEFEDSKCLKLLAKQAVITIKGNESVTLDIIRFEELMTTGSINLDCSLYGWIRSIFTNEIDEILEECDAEIDEDKYLMKGEWYKMLHAKEKIDALILKAQQKTLHQHNEAISVQNISPCDGSNRNDIGLESISTFSNVSIRGKFESGEKVFQLGENLDVDSHCEQDPIKTSVQLEVCRHMLEYIKMTDGGKLNLMINEYHIKEEQLGDDKVVLNFPKPDVVVSMQRITYIFEDAKRNSVKEIFDPIGCTDNRINLAVEAVREKFYKMVYVSYINEDCRMPIVFIGPSKDICDEAISNFESAIFGDSKLRSNCVDGNEDSCIELYHYKFCNGELLLRVLKGDIVDQKSDAIVNAANKHLHDGGGVTGAIYNAGGDEFRNRCRETMELRDYVPLEIGEVVVTKACGKLGCKSVLHATAPKYYECEGCLEKMQLACYQIFFKANAEQLKSVSIPAMGTGIYGVPIPLFCKALMQSIVEICENIKKDEVRYLKEIRLVNCDRYEASEIATRLEHEVELSLNKARALYGDDVA